MRPDRVQEASFTVLWKIGRTGLRRKAFGIWSGLSESNRHLNLGKVPYYHYTKAAQPPSFYSMPARHRQAFLTQAGLEPNGPKAKSIRRPELSGRTSPLASGAGAQRSG